jgi:hypothetical protein
MLKWHFKKLSCESIGRRWVHAFTVGEKTIIIDSLKIMLYNEIERMFDMFCKEE